MEWEMQHQTSGKMAQTAHTKLKKLRQNNKDAVSAQREFLQYPMFIGCHFKEQLLINIEAEIAKEVALHNELETKLKILTSSKEDYELQASRSLQTLEETVVSPRHIF